MRRLLILALATSCFAQTYLDDIPTSHPAIQYLTGPVDDPVSHLSKKLQFRTDGLGYLPALLDALGINVDSQALVFSKDSSQAEKISPRRPRAIYFNDDSMVGFVPGGNVIEVASIDPRQGVIFYTVEQKPDAIFKRQEVCLHCHQGPATLGIPGIFIGSVFPNAAGVPARQGAIITDHRTPFADRWGGWFVDATSGEQKDRANAVASDPAEPMTLEPFTRAFDKAQYLSPTSDIVALMTLEHQTQVTNLMIRLNWEARISAREPDIEPLVRYMLFQDEVPLPEPVVGVSTFTKTFPQRGPLRDFDLRTRLFRYPLSYMIRGRIFEALPARQKERIHRRLSEELTARDQKEALLPPL